MTPALVEQEASTSPGVSEPRSLLLGVSQDPENGALPTYAASNELRVLGTGHMPQILIPRSAMLKPHSKGHGVMETTERAWTALPTSPESQRWSAADSWLRTLGDRAGQKPWAFVSYTAATSGRALQKNPEGIKAVSERKR